MAKIWGFVFGVLAVISLVISVMSFKEKGYLFNNAYIWASKEERENLDKKPWYRQSAICFAMTTVILLCLAIGCYYNSEGWSTAAGMLCIIALIYAIKSKMSIERN